MKITSDAKSYILDRIQWIDATTNETITGFRLMHRSGGMTVHGVYYYDESGHAFTAPKIKRITASLRLMQFYKESTWNEVRENLALMSSAFDAMTEMKG